MRQAKEVAKKRWVRVQSNQGARAYDVFEARAKIPEPEWPEWTLADYLRVGFGTDGVITDPQDELLLRLLGLA